MLLHTFVISINQNAEQTYHSIRQSIVSAQHKLSAAVNYAMVITYWEIGEQIYKVCGENDRAIDHLQHLRKREVPVLGVRRGTGADPSKDAAIRDREFERLSAENGTGWVCGQTGSAGAGLPNAPKQQQLESDDPQSA